MLSHGITTIEGLAERQALDAARRASVAALPRYGSSRHGDRSGWVLARERDGGYDAATGEGEVDAAADASSDPASEDRGDTARVLQRLEGVVTAVRDRAIDALTEAELEAELTTLDGACRQLGARQSRLVAALAARRAHRARDAAKAAGRGEHVAGERAARELRQELSNGLGWSPAEAKRALDLGRRLDSSEPAGAAFDAGELGQRHAAVLADTLRHIADIDARAEAERDLLALAADLDPVEFGRACRRLLARLDQGAADKAESWRRARRSGRVWQAEDGMTGVSARFTGLDAETVTAAWHAFRRPDSPGERRSPEQAGADAWVAMARAALDAGVAPQDRRVAPHVQVTIDWQQVLAGTPTAEGSWTGPLPAAEIRRLLADCGVSRLLTDPAGVPFEAGRCTRNVSVALYRALRARDGGCIADGCDVPPEWSQVMHLDVPYRLQGRLTLETAGLGCSHHHHALDQLGWKVTWQGGRPILHHPERPPAGGVEVGGADPERPPAGGIEVGGAEISAPRPAGSGSRPPPPPSPPPPASPSPPASPEPVPFEPRPSGQEVPEADRAGAAEQESLLPP